MEWNKDLSESERDKSECDVLIPRLELEMSLGWETTISKTQTSISQPVLIQRKSCYYLRDGSKCQKLFFLKVAGPASSQTLLEYYYNVEISRRQNGTSFFRLLQYHQNNCAYGRSTWVSSFVEYLAVLWI